MRASLCVCSRVYTAERQVYGMDGIRVALRVPRDSISVRPSLIRLIRASIVKAGAAPRQTHPRQVNEKICCSIAEAAVAAAEME